MKAARALPVYSLNVLMRLLVWLQVANNSTSHVAFETLSSTYSISTVCC